MAPAAAIAAFHCDHLVHVQVVHHDDVTASKPGHEPLADEPKVIAAVTEPGWVISRGFSPSRMAPLIEIVFQFLQGRVPTTRFPIGARPYARRIPVSTNDSSMKTSAGRRAHERERRRPNAAAGSPACRALSRRTSFCSRVPHAGKRTVDGRAAGCQVLGALQGRGEFGDRGVGHRVDE